MSQQIRLFISWYQTGTPHPDEPCFCPTRDIFQGRIESYFRELCTIQPSQQTVALLIAAMGEIGNNSFDHNLGKWQDDSGMVFYKGIDHCLIVDRGQGIRGSLQEAGVRLESDEEYIQTAFTQVISGRAPEKRGNGLKLVAAIVERLNLSLYLRSGKGKITLGPLSFDGLDRLLEKQPNPGVFSLLNWSAIREN